MSAPLSASSSLSRARSLRKTVPGLSDDVTRESASRIPPPSPSRLPVKGGISSARATPSSAAAIARSQTNHAPTDTDRATTARAIPIGRTSSVHIPGQKPAPAAPRSRPSGSAAAPAPSRTSSTRLASTSSVASSAAGEVSRPPITARTRPTPGVRPTSAGSMYAPGTAAAARSIGGVEAAGTRSRVGGVGHVRAKSSATALTNATTLRPPERTQDTSTSGREGSARISSVSVTSDRSRPPISNTNTSRTAAPHRRQGSSSTQSLVSAATSTQSRPSVTTQTQVRKINPPGPSASTSASSTHTIITQAPQLTPITTGPRSPTRLRPAFNTNQQHYSPAKSLAPKPLTSAILAPASPSKLPANMAASAETLRVQTELLHLSLLHRDVPAVHAEWRASARRTLGARFDGLAREHARLASRERAARTARNVQALQAWGGGGTRGGTVLDDKIQGLDGVLDGLWALGEPGGRYAKAVRRFERWAQSMGEIATARAHDEQGPPLDEHGEVVFVGDLGASWKEECSDFVRRLEGWRRTLEDIGNVPVQTDDGRPETEARSQDGKSSLEMILEACRALVDNMLAELDVMECIERDAAAHEMEWIRQTNGDGQDAKNAARPAAGAIWRAF